MPHAVKERTMDSEIERFLVHLKDEKRYSGNTLAAYRNDLVQFGHFLQGRGVMTWGRLRQDRDPGLRSLHQRARLRPEHTRSKACQRAILLPLPEADGGARR